MRVQGAWRGEGNERGVGVRGSGKQHKGKGGGWVGMEVGIAGIGCCVQRKGIGRRERKGGTDGVSGGDSVCVCMCADVWM